MLSETALILLGAFGGLGVGTFASMRILAERSNPLQSRKRLSARLRKLRDDHALMKLVVEHANDGILIQDLEGHIEWCNPAYSRLTGYSIDEITGKKPQEFILPPHMRPSREEIASFRYDISSGVLEDFESIRNVRKDGTEFWNQLSFAVAEFADGAEPKVVVIARDITEQVEREKSLKLSESRNRALAEIDSLTQLPNRLKLTQYLEEQVNTARVANKDLGVLHIDLDRFKSINDTMGHAAGDKVLKHTAKEMLRIVGKKGFVGRFGGDEFLVICPDVENFATLQTLAEEILVALEEPFKWNDKLLRFGCSIGAAMMGKNAQTANDLIKHADVALYEVKKRGRHGVACFNDALGLIYERRMTLSAQLAQAIEANQIDVDLQPQFSLEKKRVHGFEALVRWYHPELGKLGPHEFLEIAEQNGLMPVIDRIAAQKAFAALSELKQAGHEDLRISINVSTASLNGEDFVGSLCNLAKEHDIAPDEITVEVLETNLLDGGSGANLDAIRELASEGFYLELDDFGMGYAGLAHLTRLATNGLKIDRSMTRNMLLDPATFTIIRAVIGLCQELSMSVVAEGVEEVEQAELLQEAGCDIIQGFGVGHPMPLALAKSWLEDVSQSPVICSIISPDALEDEFREFLAS